MNDGQLLVEETDQFGQNIHVDVTSCPRGNYCKNNVQYICPAGTYGNTLGLSTPLCSGLCVAGFYCPEGTINYVLNRCGAVDKYCPQGSSTPLLAPEGYYTTPENGNVMTRTGIEICPPGHHCTGGLTTSECSGLCEAGYYCPPGSTNSTANDCGSVDKYCPEGSGSPIDVSEGYYSGPESSNESNRSEQTICPIGSYCVNGVKNECPAGTYGSTEGLSNEQCSGLCEAGYYCPPGSTNATANDCGSVNKYCPEGSGSPIDVSEGYYSGPESENESNRSEQTICPIGSYCVNGVKNECPAGLCEAGYYCLAGSTNATANDCGSVDKYCPEGSGSPIDVSEGYYSGPESSNESNRSEQTICPIGSYCVNGVKNECPAGTYGSIEGLTTSECSGLCEAGYYCLAGSTNATANDCGSVDKYCPEGSGSPIDVSEGYYSGPESSNESNRSEQTICPIGSYCVNGVKNECPAGTYGSTEGLTTSECSGLCEAGYYCPPGSTNATANDCGSVDKYCPEGSGSPIDVSEGYYSGPESSNESNRSEQTICPIGSYCVNGVKNECPAGTYGSIEGLTTSECSGLCEAGYYCLAGSTNATANDCGSVDKYCPEGSGSPIDVSEGYYSGPESENEANRSEQTICPIGSYCVNGVKNECPAGTYGSIEGLSNEQCSGLCEAGYYCLAGSTNATANDCGSVDKYCPEGRYYSGPESSNESNRSEQTICPIGSYCVNGVKNECPAGTYGSIEGLSNEQCSGLCEAGYYCLAGSTNATANDCGTGYYCPPGSTNATANDCGSVDKYCPEGSGSPIDVSEGYYSGPESSNESNRSEQTICPIGSYCVNGVKNECPAGTYGSIEGLSNEQCSGLCEAGYYCPPGSTNATANDCGSVDKYCPEGSGSPIDVSEGYYSGPESSNESNRSEQTICPIGSYCVNGVKNECPAGTYGSIEGLSNEQCSGLCEAGYYCPPGSTNATANDCGSVDKYCPEGSGSPIDVSEGYYSGPESRNESNRSEQTICPIGSYCVNGVKNECPAGTYGSIEGLTTSECSGLCEAGYYCLAGSTNATANDCGSVDKYCPEGSGSPIDVTNRSEQTICPIGSYCVNGVKNECPAGTYGSIEGLSNEQCSGLCEAGYYCLAGSTNATANDCGSVDKYCPEGSGSPIDNEANRSEQTICPIGSYCVNGVKNECPAGLCEAGYYCLAGSTNGTANECGSVDKYCPRGSGSPIDGSEGYYSGPESSNESNRSEQTICPIGSYCVNGVKNECPAGTYGSIEGLSNEQCSGLCEAGYYCLAGSTNATANDCGSVDKYCPEGSGSPIDVSEGYYSGPESENEANRSEQTICPIGSYCVNGVKNECPAGTYGSIEGLSNEQCSGLCEAGYYCLAGSTNATANDCGSVDKYCPEGSGSPIDVSEGYYSGPESENESNRSEQTICPIGSYCVNGVKNECPAGLCEAGYYCPPGSTNATANDCGSVDKYCPEGSGSPIDVSEGYYSGPESENESNRSEQTICPIGSYCVNGVKNECPAGTYGSIEGLTTSECSGLCEAGYYCPPGSTNATANDCGSVDKYCPEGSGSPIDVSEGYYSGPESSNESNRSEQTICPIGSYCSNGVKNECPAGTYGSSEGLSNEQCSGLCEAGYYCLAGSTNATANDCGSVDKYCPEGSGSPIDVTNRSEQTICPIGSYCVNGVKNECPAGLCEAGYYCLAGSTNSTANDCGSVDKYCPEGSGSPIDVSEGYYSGPESSNESNRSEQTICPIGSYCSNGVKNECPAGTYGSSEGLSNEQCSGLCEAGYYCLAGSTNATANDCGSVDKYCPEGRYYSGPETENESNRSEQTICPIGSYCSNGVKNECPAGTYGSTEGLTTSECSGLCEAGYYCLAGSTNATANDCGSVDKYCPEGSGSPIDVSEGYYSGPESSNESNRSEQTICPIGSYCVNGVKNECPAGTYGSIEGLSNEQCSGLCEAGYYCPPGSTNATANDCGSVDKYCPEGSGSPIDVSEGYYSGPESSNESNRSEQTICPIGSYCVNGVKNECPAGTYGSTEGLTTSECSGLCEAGYYCLAGSTNATANDCGSVDKYCPEGSGSPIDVSEGYYSGPESRNEANRSEQTICPIGSYCVNGVKNECPAGTYGSIEGLSNEQCSGLCEAGYYCPPGSTNATANDCGSVDKYCPEGSGSPIDVSEGYYSGPESSNESNRSEQTICPIGSYCVNGVKNECPAGTYGSTEGLSNEQCSGLCEAGYYCPPGSTNATANDCGSVDKYCPEGSGSPIDVSEGYYSGPESSNESNRSEQTICPIGSYCVNGVKNECPAGTYGSTEGLTTSECSGLCEAGYYCLAGSTNATANDCGSVDKYCPEGSGSPIDVSEGYYSGPESENESNRSEQTICPIGSYCVNGVKNECPAGLCEAGYYCPPGSTNATANDCGSVDKYCPEGSGSPIDVSEGYYSGPESENEANRSEQTICPIGSYCVNGVKNECPAGTYGSIEGLSNEQCSGLCEAGYYCLAGSTNATANDCGSVDKYCPEGSGSPIDVSEGYYSGPESSNESNRSEQTICPIGSYCVNGVKNECPAGTYGSIEGLTTSECSGLCEAGYYCLAGSTNATANDCGSVDKYCPEGSGSPIDNESNRSEQTICPIGSYCSNGVKNECPAGTYGSIEGLSNEQCSGLCEAGYYCLAGSTNATANDCGSVDKYCPEGSGSPIDVSEGYYSGPESSNESNRSEQTICPIGSYCVNGVKNECPAGTYGSIEGLSNEQCSGLCEAGYYCLAGSTNATANDCGSVDKYCPEGSGSPIDVSEGYYSGPESSNESNRSEQTICPIGSYCVNGVKNECPAGTYGSTEGLSNEQCSGLCEAGYYCLAGSTNSTSNDCGSVDKYCPEGSGSPIDVPDGLCSYPFDVPASNRFDLYTPTAWEICIDGM
ncbi:uncharacterized protein [Blastocystis hominis]|uniref:Uncharacterized protein n=1 Tax=Blastocystis hominis TaxID=12968 RepID=D8M6U0_BLAHO|nr:uncharacterized protein [Blastocystis hominis]CBK23508.2 unnamed protein product [Blastocystis hominis]|eukprot:XP_012897556.1 uncharacterized protein [Blastocystis hominis]